MTNQHETNPKVRSWRPRISIANLLMLITCIGLGFQNWRTYQQSEVIQKRAHELDRENQRLRDEYGEFVVDDPSLFYGAQINRFFTSSSGMLDWKWRIYTPTPYTIHFTDKNVSKIGYPKPDISRVIPSGYHTVYLHYVPHTDKDGPGWMTEINIKSEEGRYKSALRANSSDWPPRLTSANAPWPHAVPEEGIAWGTVTVLNDQSQLPNKAVVLQRLLVKPGPKPNAAVQSEDEILAWYDSLGPKEVVPGFVIWVEPNKNQ